LSIAQNKQLPIIAQSEVLFSVKVQGLSQLAIFSVNGSYISDYRTNSEGQVDVPIVSLAPGVYLYRGIVEGTPIQGKFVKYSNP
jgi:hypothetical protein